ncbi:MFS family permease [Streptosporangium album]|uniref:MFS family permease n=1 Tax=Streptosporangium album TaxID=47479 RepID=A0A7W7RRD9_9ACTN|nr:MFS transporter [Streptosporangium album]MBB4936487.1 MFS family permease [Streptosporangium album]
MIGPSFRWLWAASGLSNIGDGIVLVGVSLIAVTLTRSPLLVSLVSAAATLPWLLCALHAGAIADRHDRRRIMVMASWSRAGVLAALAVTAWLGTLSLPVLLAGALLLGIAEVFSDTSAQSVLPMAVPRDRLDTANGRLMAVQTVGNNFLGGPLAGVLIGIGSTAVLGAPALLYAMAGLALLGMRGRFRVESPSTRSLRADITDSLRYLRDHRVLRALAVFSGVLNFANAAYFAVFVLWVVGEESPVGLSASGYGILMAALAAGAVTGSLLAGRLTRRAGQVRTLLTADLVNSLLLLVPVLIPTPVAIGVTALLLGATNAVTNVIVVSLRQRLIPEDLLGRVNAGYRLIGMGASPLGAAAGGLLGSQAGLPAVFYTAAGLCVLAVALVARTVSPRSVAAAEAVTERPAGLHAPAGAAPGRPAE